MNKSFYRAADLVGAYRKVKKPKRGQPKLQRSPGMLPFSPAVLWSKVKRGTFPAPVKLSEGVTAWPAEAVDKWIEDHGGKVSA